MYDIAIVGAGPAGATLARLVGERYRTLLIDKRRLAPPPGGEPDPKCCGGLLAPDAQRMLAKMGFGLPQEVLAGPQLFAVRTIDVPNRLERYYQRSYLNVDRGRFDRWLVSLVPGRVDFMQGCVLRSLTQDDDGIGLTLARGEEIVTRRARMVVGADGAASRVRWQAFPRRPASRVYVAIQERFAAERSLPYFAAIFDPEITDFYSWIIPKDGRLIVGAALRPGMMAAARFERLKEKLKAYGFELGRRIDRSGTLLIRPEGSSSLWLGAGAVALIGEAAGWISPSSAEGISYAFRSAVALAEALEPGLAGGLERYARNTGGLRTNLLLKRLKSPFMYVPSLRKIILKTGILSIDPLFVRA